MSYGHTKNGEFIRLSCQRAASRHHVGEFGDIGSHLISPSPLDLAVVFPMENTTAELSKINNQLMFKCQLCTFIDTALGKTNSIQRRPDRHIVRHVPGESLLVRRLIIIHVRVIGCLIVAFRTGHGEEKES